MVNKIGSSNDNIDAKKWLEARASLFFILGVILLLLLLSIGRDLDIVRRIMLGFIMSLLFLGAIVMYISALVADKKKKELDPSEPIYMCKHCDEGFNNEKMRNRHEKSCLKMKL